LHKTYADEKFRRARDRIELNEHPIVKRKTMPLSCRRLSNVAAFMTP